MDIKEFLLRIYPESTDDIVIHYKERKYSAESDPSLFDILDELAQEAGLFGDLDIVVEVPSKRRYFRKMVSSTKVSPLALPLEERPDMPSVTIAFNPVTLAPEHVVLQDHYRLPVVKWEPYFVDIPGGRSPIDASYGIPFGSYRLTIALPELPEFRKRTAAIRIGLSPDINLGLSAIRSGTFRRDYSSFSYEIEEIDPEAYTVFQLVKDRIKTEQSKRIEQALQKEWESFQKTGSLDEPDLSGVLEDRSGAEAQFQAYRNMAGYRFIYFIENALRTFVWNKLLGVYHAEAERSPKWWMGCLPETVRKNIQEKISTRNPILDQLKGETTLLHYCTFNELGQIIEKEWPKFFRERPLDRNAFLGHMSYLEQIRNAIAHTRPLGHDELDLLYSNGNSVLKMLGLEMPRTTYRDILGPFAV